MIRVKVNFSVETKSKHGKTNIDKHIQEITNLPLLSKLIERTCREYAMRNQSTWSYEDDLEIDNSCVDELLQEVENYCRGVK